MKTFLVVCRVVACALWKDELIRERIRTWFFEVFGVTNADLMRTTRPAVMTTRPMELPDPGVMFDICRRLGLAARDGFYSQTAEEVAGYWNGMGPDCWPEGFREWISEKLEAVLPCSMPHDDWYVNGNDGTRKTWERTQREWRENARKCLADAGRTCGWWRRIVNAYRSALAAEVLEIGGYACWLAAYKQSAGVRT